ncbi:TVP38/TMEM64 family protein [Clostridium thailandense]|uniref:TVP38/TMEM64 family membrane protein n=1 Tax=Clostridium thailandense TaxID=2794346 RepID=A0A949U0I4_9CLOT|nr:TVP38/TMEM64 family protein [Clostridium thailandense]MBV7274019.1 TVP38/TMEM64 family protein [Clostridium thailandense]
MEQVQRMKWNVLVNGSAFIGLVLTVLAFIYGIQTHIFTSQTAMETFLRRFGWFAPFIFIIFQAVQVVLPISPGGLGCVGGVLAFGAVQGFIYNYIGICIGSIAAFLLSRRYGINFVRNISKKETFDKYAGWLQKPGFEKAFAIAIFMPVAPDDFLCYLAGVSKIKFEKFIMIILLGKPCAIAAYSFGLTLIIKHLSALL